VAAPGSPIGGGINEHGRRTGHQQPIQPALTEEVVRGDQQEQRVAQDLAPDGGQRRAVAVRPSVGIHHPDPAAPEPTTVATGPAS
jgi:hypothetical protein